MTSKLQLTVPKVIADQYRIRPGDELQWVAAGDTIRVVPPGKRGRHEKQHTLKERLELFDLATERQRDRQHTLTKNGSRSKPLSERGWTRADIYHRDLSD